jgi:DNA (cytosine-5)-methyltransferase 1
MRGRWVSAEETGRSIPLGEFIVGTAHSGGDASRSYGVDEPVKAVCGNRGDAAIIKPWLYSYYSEGPPGADIDNPVPTSTGRARFGLCYPVVEIQGNLFILDIYFRMFELRELARANGFPDHYKFPGTKTDGVKAVGNSVTCGMSRALALALIQQDSKVTPYMLEINPSATRECKNN